MNKKSLLNYKIGFLALLLIVLSGCTGKPRELAGRHNDNGGANFDISSYENLNFDNYIKNVSSAIKKYDGLNRKDDQLLDIFPFEDKSKNYSDCKKNERIGVLLIHGLTDTPFLMKDISKSLIKKQKCILTRAIVLPGHATTPGNLLNVKYSDWIDATSFGVNSFLDSGVKNIFIAGFSTGGTLALNHAIHNNGVTQVNIKGLMLFSPAIRIKPRGGFLANWHYLVSWAAPKRAWFDILDDKDYAKYESFPKNAADQVHLLTHDKIDLEGRSIPTPLLIVISSDDETVDSRLTKKFFDNRASEDSRIIIYKRHAVNNSATCDLKQRVCEKSSVYKDINISSFSHTAIPTSINNYHYGIREGAYKSCTHYLVEEKPNAYSRCMDSEYQLGEKSLKGLPVRRLTFNPDFENMENMIHTFVDSLRNI